MATVTVELPDDQLAFFKKVVARFGFALKKQAKQKAAPGTAAAHKPRTKVEQDFVDGYREMVEADNGTGPPLMGKEEFLAEWNAE